MSRLAPLLRRMRLPASGTTAALGASWLYRSSSGAASVAFDVTKENFRAEVMESSKPVVLQFTASWCGPCRMLGPVLEKCVAATDGKVRLGRVDIDEQNELAQAMNVSSVPTCVGVRDGQMVNHFIGAQPEPKIKEFINALLPVSDEE